MHPNNNFSMLMKTVKSRSSRWLAEEHRAWSGWQVGFGVLSVSADRLAAVQRYVENQRSRHTTLSFADELDHLTAL